MLFKVGFFITPSWSLNKNKLHLLIFWISIFHLFRRHWFFLLIRSDFFEEFVENNIQTNLFLFSWAHCGFLIQINEWINKLKTKKWWLVCSLPHNSLNLIFNQKGKKVNYIQSSSPALRWKNSMNQKNNQCRHWCWE